MPIVSPSFQASMVLKNRMPETLSKACEKCGISFDKPRTCGRPEWDRRRFCSYGCKAAAQLGAPSKKRERHYPESYSKTFLPCRVCGKPTRYSGTDRSSLAGMVRCDQPECVETSKLLKNNRIAESHQADYASGKRRKLHENWQKVGRIGLGEKELMPLLLPSGWITQHRIILGISSFYLPRYFDLDFAKPNLKLDVEIDGSVHHKADRKKRDARRDKLLTERGWRILRVDAETVIKNAAEAAAGIEDWAASLTN